MSGKKAAVILAAGSGKRMGADRPKQFLSLCDRPVLYWTLRAFEDSVCDRMVLVVSDEEAKDYCEKEIIEKYGITKISGIVFGGAERYDSVWEGLKWLADENAMHNDDYVCIHDGARCLVTSEVIARTLEDAERYEGTVAAVPVKDTIKFADKDGYGAETPDRKLLWQMQTPQTFSFPLIYRAYQRLSEAEPKPVVTDDAQVLELLLGQKSYLTMASYENFKITTPEDMVLAEAVLRNRN